MATDFDIQIALADDDACLPGVPSADLLQRWVEAALRGRRACAAVTLRVVDENEMAELNRTYRHKAGVTNVLSFPFEAPPGVDVDLLGDIVVCAAVVQQEARAQGKSLDAHWCHMTVHGVLHLLGYDHMTDADAAVMESLEIDILAGLGYSNPYQETDAA